MTTNGCSAFPTHGEDDLPSHMMENQKMRRIESEKWRACGPIDIKANFILFGMTGAMYFTSTKEQTIRCFAPNGNFQSALKLNPLSVPVAFAVGVGVGDGINDAIVRALTDVPALSAFPPGVVPMCAAYCGDDELYVCEHNTNLVHVYTPTWKHRRIVDMPLRLNGETISGGALDRQGRLYIAREYLWVFDPEGKQVESWRKWATEEHGDCTLVATSEDDFVYIVKACCLVHRVDRSGVIVGTFSLSPHCVDPLSIAVSSGILYVVCFNTKGVLEYNAITGEFLRLDHSTLPFSPSSICVGPSGTLYAVHPDEKRLFTRTV